ncbi:Na(+)-translocating NADH-quinone reductase subunit C [Aeoliella mucimassa]|uniref:Na(+)-translocating NADH-quinone reductase subunit C n=1 Tax=Aeoliella mucimassa TaxID=2527972 RepID=A0A518AMY4_9BACT|nr:Na(+)-translocating NADH-quinone reductase subunit C [Aeoliella mucimassa]QDU56092.1 Na(+)-translocating NADH-quinone reductase subunit C [Aeoliella mucimassa]
MERDSFLGTILVALGVCVVCSVLVASSAVLLNGRQEENKLLYKQLNVLRAANLVDKKADLSKEEVDAIIEKRVTTLLVDLEDQTVIEDWKEKYSDFDPRDAANSKELGKEIEGVTPSPGIKRRAKMQFVYEIHAEGDPNKIEQYVLPVSGKGLWSTLYGFLSINADGKTVEGITFYEHAETPGLGGEVENPTWQQKWEGKLAYNDEHEVVIKVIKGSAPSSGPGADTTIDGLSGATITTNGVSNFVQYWLGPDGFGPFLQKQTAGSDL